jgi:hypothetical protein
MQFSTQTLYRLFAISLFFFVSLSNVGAQWSYSVPVTITNNVNALVTNYQVPIYVNTSTPIAASQMLSNGDDIRFAKDFAGSVQYNYYIDSGINTTSTKIWVKIDTLFPSSTRTIYFKYGNAVAPAASTLNTFNGPYSSTNQVSSGSAGGVGNSQRGFRFSPNHLIIVSQFGKKEPTGTTRYVTIFDFTTQAIVQQAQVPGATTSYVYSNLGSPIWLNKNQEYLLELYQGSGDGYYFGASSQINNNLTYYDMRYCNSCSQNTFPTNILPNFQYGYPDFTFYTCDTNVIATPPTIVVGIGGCVGLPAFTLGSTSSRCQAAGTVTYSATASNSTGITYSLDATSISNGCSINSSTGAVTYPGGYLGTAVVTATATGACGSPTTSTHTVTTDGTVTAPAFILGSTTSRCQGAGIVTYTASATNATSISYSLDGPSMSNGVAINSSTGAVTYPAGYFGNAIITAVAAGCSGPATQMHIATTNGSVSIPLFAIGSKSTRCQGAGTVTYTAGATNTTGITYSLDATSLGAGCTINSATGAVTFAAAYNGLSVITASAAGCNGPNISTHTVNSISTVGTPVFVAGATSTRCQGISAVTYTASATNASGITYSLDATSLGSGNAINAATGMVTYVAGWSGTSTITASATGCNGPSTSTHTVTITPTVGTPAFTLGTTSTRCQGAGAVTYTATATNSTGITYSLDAASLTATNSINSSTGVVTYVAGWSGTSVITASAAGCNGPVVTTHTVTVTPTVGTPTFTFGATSTRCQGVGTVTYTASSTNTTGITYTLDATSLGAGNTINASTGAVTYTAAWSGTSTITASAAGCNGPAVSTHTVTTSALPVATFTATPAANICASTSATYTTQAGQFNYNWNVPGVAGVDYVITAGGIGTISNTVTLTWLTAGAKTVTVSYANASGCTPLIAATNTTTVNARPVVTFTTAPGANSCANNDITYTTQGGQSNYIWSVPGTLGVDYTISSGSLATTSNTVTLKWLTTGSKTVSVNYTNSGNCAAFTATSNTTTVNALPTVTFTSAPSANICIGSSTVTYATQAGQSNYLWSVSGTQGVDYTVTAPGLSTTNSNVTITWLTTGSKAVTVNYTNSAGCTALAPTTSNTTVNALPTVSAGSNVSICAGSSTTLTATGATTYSWSPATGLSSTTGASVIATPTTTTTYTVTGTSSGTSLIYSQAFTNGASSPAQGAVWASYIAGLPSSGVTSFIIRGSNDPVGITCTNAGIAQSVANALRTNGSFSGSSNGHTWYVGGCGGGPELSADYGICSCPSPSYCVRPMIGNDNWGGINTATCFGPSQTMEVVFIIGSGGGSCSNTATVTVTVNPRPTITFSAAPGTASCAGSPVTYTTQAGQSNYAWSVPGTSGVDYTITAGGIGTTSNTVTLIWLTAGSKTVSVNYSNGSGCSAATATSNTTTVSALPIITTQPANFSMCANNNTSISVVATGANGYQWQCDGGSGNWSNLSPSAVYPSTNTASLSINNPGAGINGFKFRCMVMNNSCPVLTTAVTATVNSPVNVQSHPANAVACVGTTTSFTTIVTGTSFSYQWQVSTGTAFTNLTNTGIYSGVNSSVLVLTGVTMAQTGNTYRCALIDLSCSGVTATGGASLTINPAPAITKKADTVSGCTGNTLMFATVASGQGLTYQWQMNDGTTGYTDIINNTAYDGAKTPTLTLYYVNTTMNVYTYRCIVSGICNPVATTNVYKLDIKPSPVVTVQPASASKYIGDSVTFDITATGAGLTYQWQENSGNGFVNLLDVGMYTGTKTAQLKVGPALTFSMSGYLYRCMITGTCGVITTKVDTLAVKKSFNTAVTGITTMNPMVVYPNPVNEGSLTIMFGEMMKGNTHFDVLDKMGRLVKTVDVAALAQGKYATLEVDNLPAGVYTIRVLNETEGFRSMVQFVKQ